MEEYKIFVDLDGEQWKYIFQAKSPDDVVRRCKAHDPYSDIIFILDSSNKVVYDSKQS